MTNDDDNEDDNNEDDKNMPPAFKGNIFILF